MGKILQVAPETFFKEIAVNITPTNLAISSL